MEKIKNKNNNIKIAPSLFAANFANLSNDISIIEKEGAEFLHLDVMDGIFVPNLSIGPQILKSIRPISKMIFDVHLMIVKPERFINDFVKAGADYITIHFESTDKVEETIDYIKECGIRPGLSIKPKTPVESIEHLIEKLSMVLIMSIEPGFGGQPFIPESLKKITRTRELIDKHNPSCELEVDGGINLDNVTEVVISGATVIVAGSSIFGTSDIAQTIKNFKNKFNEIK
jgi:ribulose-phosphate 3-epimerase